MHIFVYFSYKYKKIYLVTYLPVYLNIQERILILKNFLQKLSPDIPDDHSTLYHFLRTGICILSTVCLSSIAVAFMLSDNSTVTSRQAMSSIISEKKLPIYCVDTDKPKVALSFDAAWGDIILMNQIH